MNINFENRSVALFCMLPSILLSSLMLPRQPVLLWVTGFFLVLGACGIAYHNLRLLARRWGWPASGQLLGLLLTQGVFWWAMFTLHG